MTFVLTTTCYSPYSRLGLLPLERYEQVKAREPRLKGVYNEIHY